MSEAAELQRMLASGDRVEVRYAQAQLNRLRRYALDVMEQGANGKQGQAFETMALRKRHQRAFDEGIASAVRAIAPAFTEGPYDLRAAADETFVAYRTVGVGWRLGAGAEFWLARSSWEQLTSRAIDEVTARAPAMAQTRVHRAPRRGPLERMFVALELLLGAVLVDGALQLPVSTTSEGPGYRAIEAAAKRAAPETIAMLKARNASMRRLPKTRKKQ